MPSQPAAAAQATPLSGVEYSKGAAGEFAQKLGRRRIESGAPVRNIFVVTQDGKVPPLAALLRGGGRGGHVRVKLYLSLLWVCTAAPYETIYPARAWAALLGLDDPDARGTRRIQEATRDLAARKFITVQDRGGLPSLIRILDESGSGAEYTPPSKTFNALRGQRASYDILQHHQYFKIPSKVWTDGHIANLTGPGIAMLTVLLCEQRGNDGEVWFTPEIADNRFKLAPATRTAGLNELRKLGLITTRKAPVSHDGAFISFRRLRNVHALWL